MCLWLVHCRIGSLETEALLLGTPAVYGATHQFGRDNIPARPFLGVSAADADDIMSALSEWLSESAES